MSHTAKTASTSATDLVPALGRVLMASIFVFSALGKLAAPQATIGYIQSVGLPFATLGLVLAVAVELGGGLMLIFGIKSKAAAAVLAAFSLVTGLAFHHAIGDQNQLIHLLKNVAMAGGLLQIVLRRLATCVAELDVDERAARIFSLLQRGG